MSMSIPSSGDYSSAVSTSVSTTAKNVVPESTRDNEAAETRPDGDESMAQNLLNTTGSVGTKINTTA
ncbi:hypothetical protein [Musicola paradisiaca]|uniref:Uncharacterized protein n=1 Tax=Musicola paradisiaca (strain Ech703) TaxID=579405 RepID=C6C335_MUSP7|nr:hypothetical protein [Musicola paradisiaca]ACS85300.1 hypothetical protein Dd703_1500 [Musicola paradisiaca Ech703]